MTRGTLLATGALGLAAVLSSGCSQRLGDFTLLSSKNIDLSNFNTQSAENAPAVNGVDKRAIVIVFPTGVASLKDATDRAEEKGSAVGLTNARIVQYGWYIPYIYGEVGWDVTGNPIPR
jgi:hypothetical protein